MSDIINCAYGKHKRVYGPPLSMMVPWICEICGTEGTERAPMPDSRYQQLKAKFDRERGLMG